jgi:GDPmannose 4,6-dehydratase
MKTALITGITGQDGSYLAELLLGKGYKVVGLVRRSSTDTNNRIGHLLSKDALELVEGEVSDSGSVYTIVEKYKPDEIYNLAAQSHVGTSFQQPNYTFQVDALGPLYFLEAIKRFSPDTRFYQASTSELFGKNFTERPVTFEKFQDEDTQFMPQSPYAVAKLAAHNMVRIYREGYDIHASCGILFNHESERRGENFVTRKITKWIGNYVQWKKDFPDSDHLIEFKSADNAFTDRIEIPRTHPYYTETGFFFPKLRLGNLDAYRDWGHAEDYVDAMWRVVQQEIPDDYVIATGETHSVRDFLREAFNEIGITDFEPYVVIDPKFYRPAEVEYLCGDPSKAKDKLNWEPQVSFTELVQRMVWRDIDGQKETKKTLQQEKIL